MSWLVPATAPDPSMCVTGPRGTIYFQWDWRLVALSFAIAIIGSYAGLEYVARMRASTDDLARRRHFVAGAVLMALAIWTMHFVGMLALKMPLPVSYAAGWSLWSIMAAGVGAALAFAILSRPQVTGFHFTVGGIAMGLSIVGMHYLGMKSMQMPMTLDYDAPHFVASIIIAIVASIGALWTSDEIARGREARPWTKGGSAVIMGVAIAGMHYMGMAAARYHFVGFAVNRPGEPDVGPFPLRDVVEVAGVLFAMALMMLAARAAAERRLALLKYQQLAQELERRVEERTRELQRTNDDLIAFTDSVSHDLRGPLRTIAGFTDMLLDSHADQLDDAGKHCLQRIAAAVTRLDELLLGLLNLSQVSRAPVRREPVNLTALAQAMLADFAAQQPQRNVTCIVTEGLHADGDRALLISVLQNLLGNAWKFTQKQSAARIEFGAEIRDGRTIFFVRDNGIGFDGANASKLFGMFERLHKPGEYAGHGIGLALVKRIIDRHGGTIWAESAPGQGATFYFTVGRPM